jgi:hypothetical protein
MYSTTLFAEQKYELVAVKGISNIKQIQNLHWVANRQIGYVVKDSKMIYKL